MSTEGAVDHPVRGRDRTSVSKSAAAGCVVLALLPGVCRQAQAAGGPDPDAWATTAVAGPSEQGVVALPPPQSLEMPLDAALRARRSRRQVSTDSLSLVELSTILWAADGVSQQSSFGALRTAPSAGALYPLELYCFVERVATLPPGLYHYISPAHRLELVRRGSYREKVSRSALGQPPLMAAPLTVVATAVFERCCAKYGNRGYRYVYQEAGHVSQNLYLAAAALGLRTVVIGAFHDDDLNDLIGVDGEEEAALWLHPVGR